MRQVYALLSLAKRYGAARLNDACTTALAVEMVDIHRLRRLLEIATPAALAPPASGAEKVDKVVPIARFLRPAKQFALPLTPDQDHDTKGENRS
jgi:hypothetical protein